MWKQPKCPLIKEWIYIHNGIFSAIKSCHLLQHRVSCKKKSEKDKTTWFHSYVESKKKTKFIDTENRFVVAREKGLRVGQNTWRVLRGKNFQT